MSNDDNEQNLHIDLKNLLSGIKMFLTDSGITEEHNEEKEIYTEEEIETDKKTGSSDEELNQKKELRNQRKQTIIQQLQELEPKLPTSDRDIIRQTMELQNELVRLKEEADIDCLLAEDLLQEK